MYLLVLGFVNGSAEYYGPFKTEERAGEYAKSCEEAFAHKRRGTKRMNRWHTVPLIVPYHEHGLAKEVAK